MTGDDLLVKNFTCKLTLMKLMCFSLCLDHSTGYRLCIVNYFTYFKKVESFHLL